MGAAFGIAYLIGMLVSAGVGRSRAGISQIGTLSLETVFGSLSWTLTQMASIILWPVFLCVWLVRGRPESPWKSVRTGGGSIRIRRRTTLSSR
jgi:hypothetical protein